jgi:hypothetical protein
MARRYGPRDPSLLGASPRRDHNNPYLAILLERHLTGHYGAHAGLARHGVGTPFCDERRLLWVFAHPAQDPSFSLAMPDGWRHRYAEAYLERNRGCGRCLEILYEIGRDYQRHRGLGA